MMVKQRMDTVRLITGSMIKKLDLICQVDTIEEAAGVPAEEKEQILEVFDVYIDTFNEKDIEKYMDTLSNTQKVLI